MTFNSILWPTEFCEPSRLALRRAAAILGDDWRRLTALAVVDPLLPPAAAIAYDRRLVEEWRTDLSAFVVETIAGLDVRVAPPDVKVVEGRPAVEILRLARRERPDLIVIGTHGRSGWRMRISGSTARCVLRRAPVPVLAVPAANAATDAAGAEGDLARRPVIAVVDHAGDAAAVLGVALALAGRLHVGLIVAHTAPLDPEHVEQVLAEPRASAPVEFDMRPRGGRLLAALATSRGAGVVVLGLPQARWAMRRAGARAYRLLCRTGAPVLAIPRAARGSLVDAAGRASTRHDGQAAA